MVHQQLKIQTTAEYAESLGNWLTLMGAQAISFEDGGDQPIFATALDHTDLWENTVVTALFSEQIHIPAVIEWVKKQLNVTSLTYTSENLIQQAWEKVGLAAFKPLRFGQHLWVWPSWEPVPEDLDPNDKIVLLNPGLAFGTGTHATTALCLEWLESYSIENPVVVDYGCGSGILGLAALTLGAQRVWAVDNDPQALAATRSNSELNLSAADAAEKLRVILPGTLPVSIVQADVVIANILAKPLMTLAPLFKQILKPTGHIVLSGILLEQSQEVCAVYEQIFDTKPVVTEQEGWVRIELSIHQKR